MDASSYERYTCYLRMMIAPHHHTQLVPSSHSHAYISLPFPVSHDGHMITISTHDMATNMDKIQTHAGNELLIAHFAQLYANVVYPTVSFAWK